MLSPLTRAKIPTMPHASCRRSMVYLSFVSLVQKHLTFSAFPSTIPEARERPGCDGMSIRLRILKLLCMLSWLQFSSQVRDKRVAVSNPLHSLLGHCLQIAIDLLIQHACLVSTGPESPAIVIYDVRHHQITLFVA